jgi:uncharacterized protein (DUF924 family)
MRRRYLRNLAPRREAADAVDSARNVKKPRLKSKRTAASSDVKKERRTRSQAERILNFWLTPGHSDEDGFQIWSRWFVADPDFDRLCKALFLDSYRDAACGRLDEWKKTPRPCLALVLLLDQFPRNMFRGTARAFATDAKAREISRHAIASGFDRELPQIMRMFFYLPFEHSEHLHDQMESVRLASVLSDEYGESPEGALIRKSAEWHLETIRRFGRFPGRNQALRRRSTKEEIEFLKQVNSGDSEERYSLSRDGEGQ